MNYQDAVEQISVSELKKVIDEGQETILLDVREPHELEICSLNYTLHIPLGDLRFRLHELDKYAGSQIVVYCRSGRRSNIAVEFMKEAGFLKAKNLQGGILAWSDEIDPSLKKY